MQTADKDKKQTVAGVASRPRRFKGLTIEERQAERREKLMAAALELYGNYDFHQVKVKDICREAKLTERYFYESFEGTDTLFTCVFLQQLDKLNQEIFGAFIGVDGAAQTSSVVERTVLGFLNTIRQDKRMAKVLYTNSSFVLSADNAYTQEDVYESLGNMMENIISMTLLQGGTLTDIGRLTIAGFTGFTTQVSYKWVKSDFAQPVEQVVQIILVLIAHFMDILADKQSPLRAVLVAEKP